MTIDALMGLRNVALALSHAAAQSLHPSPSEYRRLARDVTDAIEAIGPQLRTLDEIVANAQEDDDLRHAPPPNVVVLFGERRT